MEPAPKQELDEERRAQIEVYFRRQSRIRLASIFGGILFYLGFLVVSLVLDFWDDYWPVATFVLIGSALITLGSSLKNNRCPICEHFFGKTPPTRSRRICPSCGTQLIN